MKIKIIEKEIKGKKGYDVEVLDENATVADYLQEMNSFIEQARLDRIRHFESNQCSTCMACNNCCQERIPLTWIDVLNLSEAFPLEKLFKKFIHISVVGKSVDMTLKLNVMGLCHFNKAENGLCSYYANRPFVCQSYICCASSLKAKLLRETIVNTGEDQLVREWLRMVGAGKIEFRVDEAEDFNLDEEDWGPTAYEGKRYYCEVPIKELCTSKLWDKLNGSVP